MEPRLKLRFLITKPVDLVFAALPRQSRVWLFQKPIQRTWLTELILLMFLEALLVSCIPISSKFPSSCM